MQESKRPAPFNVVQGDTEGTTWALPDGASARFGKGEHAQPSGDVKLSPDGMYFATATDIGLWWYDVSSMSPIGLWETERGGITAIDFSPDGRNISIANWDGILKMMDVQSGENIATLWGHPTDIQSLAFSPDGTLLVSGGFDRTILLWDLKTLN